ncbi:bifunctional uridylate/adenylate kinase [Sorochytrium milnesiophthora]
MFRQSVASSFARRSLQILRRSYAQQPPAPPGSSTSNHNNNQSSNKAPLVLGVSAVASVAAYLAYEGYWTAKAPAPLDNLPPTGLPAGSPFKRKPTIVFVLGGPGAGKGTQCAKLVSQFQFVHLSAGDLLREERQRPGSEFGDLINNYIKEGKIVPMHITIKLLEKAMLASGKDRFLIDGFPRAMDQAEEFERTVATSDFILYFSCPEEELLKRLMKRGETSGRVDDNPESIRKRFKTFHEQSYPVVARYKELQKVHEISCLGTPDQVNERIAAIFQNLPVATAKR